MNPLIKQLFDQSFDVEAFAHRIVLRCATTAKLAMIEGKDPYTEIMSKYGGEVAKQSHPSIHPGECPVIGEEPNELI
jgi:hypothetical protein